MNGVRRFGAVAFLALLVVSASPSPAGSLGGVGVLGDSYSDEYAFYPPHRSMARNWVEILAHTRGIDFGAYSAVSRGEPRNQGYAYNWARSDAETSDMIATGQHTGVAAQIRNGEVGLVFLFIGGNDFIHALQARRDGAELAEVLARAQSNLRLALDTVLAASPHVKVVVATVPDITSLPEFEEPIRQGTLPRSLAGAYASALRTYNGEIRRLVGREPRAALVDLDLATRVGIVLNRDTLPFGAHKIDRHVPADDVDHFFLADVRHVGTVGQGIIAQLFVEAVNSRFGAGIRPLGSVEIIGLATALASATTHAPRDPSVMVTRLHPLPIDGSAAISSVSNRRP